MRRWTRLIEERPQANGNAAANVLLSVSVEPEVRPGHVMPSHDSSLLPNKRVPTLSLSPSLPLLSLPTRLHPFSPPSFPPTGGKVGEGGVRLRNLVWGNFHFIGDCLLRFRFHRHLNRIGTAAMGDITSPRVLWMEMISNLFIHLLSGFVVVVFWTDWIGRWDSTIGHDVNQIWIRNGWLGDLPSSSWSRKGCVAGRRSGVGTAEVAPRCNCSIKDRKWGRREESRDNNPRAASADLQGQTWTKYIPTK